MTNENLKAWIIHLQKRIILTNSPDIIDMLLLNLLTCKYNNITCITNECEIVQYLNSKLPCLDYEPYETPIFDSSLTYTIPLDPCSFYDLRLDVFIGTSTTPFTYTLLNNPSSFEFIDGYFVFSFNGIISDFPEAFPNNISVEVFIKNKSTDISFVKKINKLLIGYVVI